jgi:hypothetical protein
MEGSESDPGAAAAIAERSAGAATTLEKPGIDGNQLDDEPVEPVEPVEEQPEMAIATKPMAPQTVAERPSRNVMPIESSECLNRRPGAL